MRVETKMKDNKFKRLMVIVHKEALCCKVMAWKEQYQHSSINRNVFTKKWVGKTTIPTNYFLEEIEAEYGDNI